LRIIELKNGGTDIYLTEENKYEYIQLWTTWRLFKEIEDQIKAFCLGFNSVIPVKFLDVMTV